MKGFLEEYGLIIVVVSVIMIMLLLGTTVGEDIKTNIVAVVASLFEKANTLMPTLTNPGAPAAGGALL